MYKIVTVLSFISWVSLSLLGMQEASFCHFSQLPQEIRQLIITHALDKNHIAQSLRDLRLVNKEFNSFLSLDSLTRQNIIKILAENLDVSPRTIALNIIKVFGLNPDDPITQKLLGKNPVNEALSDTLIKAAQDGKVVQVKNLLKQEADVNAHNKEGVTTLMHASFYGYKPLVELLLNAGADVNTQDVFGRTALSIAEDRGDQKIINLLKQHLA